MRTIAKGREPSCLVALKTTSGSDWSSVHGDQKSEIVARLYADQHGLCAYCMRRLAAPTTAAVRVEHWAPRHEADADPFAWKDLLGVCDGGGDGAPPRDQHCDRRKGGRALSVHPARDADLEHRIRFRGDGRLADGIPRDELVDVLNLDHPRLIANRKAVIDAVLIVRRNHPDKLDAQLQRYREPGPDGLLPEYVTVALARLEKAAKAEAGRRQRVARAKRSDRNR
ncbi:MAG: hypothetical protein KC621_15455 [Myxococcales bacterium]|nr:hypothetical protein [Myxococcales bacterium]